jgi:hypothetical protein
MQGLTLQTVNSFVSTGSIRFDRFNQSTTTMPCSYISTPLNGVDGRIVLAALHNHDIMIRTLCPALVSYHLESGDRTTQATYAITDRKPVSLVSSTPSLHSLRMNRRSINNHTDNISTHTHKRIWRRRLPCQRQTARRRPHHFREVACCGRSFVGGS